MASSLVEAAVTDKIDFDDPSIDWDTPSLEAAVGFGMISQKSYDDLMAAGATVERETVGGTFGHYTRYEIDLHGAPVTEDMQESIDLAENAFKDWNDRDETFGKWLAKPPVDEFDKDQENYQGYDGKEYFESEKTAQLADLEKKVDGIVTGAKFEGSETGEVVFDSEQLSQVGKNIAGLKSVVEDALAKVSEINVLPGNFGHGQALKKSIDDDSGLSSAVKKTLQLQIEALEDFGRAIEKTCAEFDLAETINEKAADVLNRALAEFDSDVAAMVNGGGSEKIS
jgi:hypothetical protein